MFPIDNLSATLTPNVIKHEHFSRDDDYIRAFRLLVASTSGRKELLSFLWNVSAMIVRPDAIAGKQSRNIFEILNSRGIFPCAVRRISVSEAQVEKLWRYQLNVATPERKELLKKIMGAGDSVYMLFRDTSARYMAPATVHLTYLKGTARIDSRKEGHLRTAAGPAVANIFSYLHISDDPADLIREMGLLFDAEGTRELFREALQCNNRLAQAKNIISSLEALIPDGAFSKEVSQSGVTRIEDVPAISLWQEIIREAIHCTSFISGETYIGADAIVPDDKEHSLRLDGHLAVPHLGEP